MKKQIKSGLNAISLALFFGIAWMVIAIIIGSWQIAYYLFIRFSNLFN